MVGGRVGVIMDHPAPHFTILVWWGESNVVAVRLLMGPPSATISQHGVRTPLCEAPGSRPEMSCGYLSVYVRRVHPSLAGAIKLSYFSDSI